MDSKTERDMIWLSKTDHLSNYILDRLQWSNDAKPKHSKIVSQTLKIHDIKNGFFLFAF